MNRGMKAPEWPLHPRIKYSSAIVNNYMYMHIYCLLQQMIWN